MSRFLFSLCVTFLLLQLQVFSQNAVKLTSDARKEVVNAVSKRLIDHYVYADTAARMAAYIKLKLKDGKYNGITDPVVFAEQLLADLRSVYADGHLLIRYDSRPSNLAQAPATPNNNDPFRELKEANFGFQKVEILPGNIGYLSMLSFRADPVYGMETMKGALRFVQYTNAIIIDLRSNGGGSQETATMLMGFFLDKKILVERFYNRYTKENTDYWTRPDSNFKDLWTKPVYVLTSHKSFSAAEMFAYDMKALKRVIIVGETTGGGAHGQFEADVTNGFTLQVPYWTSINPITKTNWERVGVEPDIKTNENAALETAEKEIFRTLISNAKTSTDSFNLAWQLELLESSNHPVNIDSLQLKKFVGTYGERTFTFEAGKLHYQRAGRPKFELEPLTKNRMRGKNNTYFKIEFINDANNDVNRIKVYYQDGRVEEASRNL
ncbi:MAG: S41 family peptidase [Bacteroidia bacterium]|nr:S41 family peptidase [Bacteroidia bacterium]